MLIIYISTTKEKIRVIFQIILIIHPLQNQNLVPSILNKIT